MKYFRNVVSFICRGFIFFLTYKQKIQVVRWLLRQETEMTKHRIVPCP